MGVPHAEYFYTDNIFNFMQVNAFFKWIPFYRVQQHFIGCHLKDNPCSECESYDQNDQEF